MNSENEFEKFRTPENIPIPATLDVIRLAGRWAQVLSTGRYDPLVKFLDDGTSVPVDLREYPNFKSIGQSIANYKLESGEGITDEEMDNVYWESGEDRIEVRQGVIIFGEYNKE